MQRALTPRFATDRPRARVSTVPAGDEQFEAWQMQLHGHRVIYHMIGSGPPIVLVHGMVNSSRHWREVALALADVTRSSHPT